MDLNKRFPPATILRTNLPQEPIRDQVSIEDEINEIKEGLSVVVSPGRSSNNKVIRVDVGAAPIKKRTEGFRSLPDQVDDLVQGMRHVEAKIAQINDATTNMGLVVHQKRMNPGWKWLTMAMLFLIADNIAQAVESIVPDQMDQKDRSIVHAVMIVCALLCALNGIRENVKK